MPRGRREHSSPGALGPRMPQLSKGCGRLLAVDGQRHQLVIVDDHMGNLPQASPALLRIGGQHSNCEIHSSLHSSHNAA